MKWAGLVASIALPWVLLVLHAGCNEPRPPILDQGAGGGGGAPGSACNVPGETRKCGVELGTSGGATRCVVGDQVCKDGVWSACVADGTKPTFRVPAPSALRADRARRAGASYVMRGGLSPQAVPAVGGPATDCNEPCDPYCHAFVDQPDAAIDGVTGFVDAGYSTIGGGAGSVGTAGYPAGTAGNGEDPRNACQTAAPGSPEALGACQFDAYCDPSVPAGSVTNHCTPFKAFQSGPTASCSGIDVTSPPSCASGATKRVTLCNRGDQPAPAGLRCYAYPSGTSGPNDPYPNSNPGLTGATQVFESSKTLAAGECETRDVTATLPDGTYDVMCNVPDAIVTPGSDGPRFATLVVGDTPAGTWSNTSALVGPTSADGNDAHATLGALRAATPTPGNVINGAGTSGWTTPDGADAPGGAVATASPPLSSGGPLRKLPTIASTPTGQWVNVAAVLSDTDANAAATTSWAEAIPTIDRATTDAQDECNGAAASATNPCGWKSGAAYAATNAHGGPDAIDANDTAHLITASVAPGDTARVFLGTFNDTTLPAGAAITSVTVAVWDAISVASADARIDVELCHSATSCTAPKSLTALGATLNEDSLAFSAAELAAAGIVPSDFANDAYLVRLSAVRVAGGTAVTRVISVDTVGIDIDYVVPGSDHTLTVDHFGFDTSASPIPTGATITGLTIETHWAASDTSHAQFALQPFAGGTALDAEAVQTPPPTSLATNPSFVYVAPAAVVATLTPATFADGTFRVATRARLTAGATADYTASFESIHVTVAYTTSTNDATVYYTRLGFDAIPPTATIESLTMEVGWSVTTPLPGTTPNPYATLGLQLVTDAAGARTALGPELTQVGPASTLTTQALTFAGTGITPAMLSDLGAGGGVNLALRLQARRGTTADAANTDFTANVDFVRLTVVYDTLGTTSVTVGGFGFAIAGNNPRITSITAETRWSITDAAGYPAASAPTGNANAALGMTVLSNGTPIGTATSANPPTSDAAPAPLVVAPGTGLGSAPADVNGAALSVRFTATRPTTASAGGTYPSPVNPPFTANVDFVRVTIAYTTDENDHHVAECNPYNNWSALKTPTEPACVIQGTPILAPFQTTRVFQASCPNGETPKWTRFGYTTQTPGDASVELRLRTFDPANGSCTAAAPLLTGATSAVARLTPDTQVCDALGAPTPTCPVALPAALLGGTEYGACLQMDAVGNLTSDGLSTPSLVDWTAVFDCAPKQ